MIEAPRSRVISNGPGRSARSYLTKSDKPIVLTRKTLYARMRLETSRAAHTSGSGRLACLRLSLNYSAPQLCSRACTTSPAGLVVNLVFDNPPAGTILLAFRNGYYNVNGQMIATPYIWLHIGNPGNPTASRCLTDFCCVIPSP